MLTVHEKIENTSVLKLLHYLHDVYLDASLLQSEKVTAAHLQHWAMNFPSDDILRDIGTSDMLHSYEYETGEDYYSVDVMVSVKPGQHPQCRVQVTKKSGIIVQYWVDTPGIKPIHPELMPMRKQMLQGAKQFLGYFTQDGRVYGVPNVRGSLSGFRVAKEILGHCLKTHE